MKSSKKLLFGKTILLAFVTTMVITILAVFLTGLEVHRSVENNALISLGILAAIIFGFLAICLYKGLNVFDNYSHKLTLTWGNALKRFPSAIDPSGADIGDFPTGDGIGGIIAGIIFWIVITIVLVFLLIFLQALVWATFVLTILALYWIIIRALKLIFAKSKECENQLGKSVAYAFGYTLLYIGWIYGVILIAAQF